MSTPPPLTPTDVKAIAELSRVRLTDQELTQATQQLRSVLAHFAAIQHIATADTPPADAVSGLTNVARTDEVSAEALCSTDVLLAAAPATTGRHLRVPAVFE